jgi:hypothetical protein
MAGKTQVIDLTGLQFDCLTVIRREGFYRTTTQAAWLCRCECGNERIVSGDNLRRGKQKSCGRKGCKQGGRKTHGRSGESIYTIWMSMHDRCSNPNNASYHRYGGREIEVCARWLTFENFLQDMGERPPGLTLERIDNNFGYYPMNCRWATRKEQANNTRRNVIINATLGRLTLTEAAAIAGVTKAAIQYRIRMGLTGDRLLAPGIHGRRLSTIS